MERITIILSFRCDENGIVAMLVVRCTKIITPVFRDARYQRGHGLGNVIGGQFRRVVLPFVQTSAKVPFLTKNKKTLIKNALRTGMENFDIVREDALIKRTAGDEDGQTGSGFQKRLKTRRKRDALS